MKALIQPDKLGILCAQCRLRHRLTGKAFHVPDGPGVSLTETIPKSLTHCVAHHPEDMRIAEVDIDNGIVHLLCRTCPRRFIVEVALFETHQP